MIALGGTVIGLGGTVIGLGVAVIGLGGTDSKGTEYLEFTERSTKTRSGAKRGDYRMVAPKMFSQPNNPNCTMKMFKTYLNHMPEDIKNQPTSRFYLRPLTNPASSVWYSHLPIGKNTIRKMMKIIASLGELELEGRKTNHSTRKTFATDLLDADIPNTELEIHFQELKRH